MNLSYSRYAALPVDRDLERVHAELRALPTPEGFERCPERRARNSWLRLLRVPPRARHV